MSKLTKSKKGSTKPFDKVLNGTITLGVIAVALVLMLIIVTQFAGLDTVIDTDGDGNASTLSYGQNTSSDMLAVLATVPDWAQIGFIFAIGLALLAGVMALRNMRSGE